MMRIPDEAELIELENEISRRWPYCWNPNIDLVRRLIAMAREVRDEALKSSTAIRC